MAIAEVLLIVVLILLVQVLVLVFINYKRSSLLTNAELANARSNPKLEGRYVLLTEADLANIRSNPKLEGRDVGIVLSEGIVQAFQPSNIDIKPVPEVNKFS